MWDETRSDRAHGLAFLLMRVALVPAGFALAVLGVLGLVRTVLEALHLNYAGAKFAVSAIIGLTLQSMVSLLLIAVGCMVLAYVARPDRIFVRRHAL